MKYKSYFEIVQEILTIGRPEDRKTIAKLRWRIRVLRKSYRTRSMENDRLVERDKLSEWVDRDLAKSLSYDPRFFSNNRHYRRMPFIQLEPPDEQVEVVQLGDGMWRERVWTEEDAAALKEALQKAREAEADYRDRRQKDIVHTSCHIIGEGLKQARLKALINSACDDWDLLPDALPEGSIVARPKGGK